MSYGELVETAPGTLERMLHGNLLAMVTEPLWVVSGTWQAAKSGPCASPG